MNKHLLIILTILLIVGALLYLFRADIPLWKDVWAGTIAPHLATGIVYIRSIVMQNPLEWFMGSIGGIVASVTAITKIWGSLNKKKQELTSTVNTLQETAGLSISKLQAEKDKIIAEKTQLFDANQTLTSELHLASAKLGTIPTLEKERDDLAIQLQTARDQITALNHAIENMDKKVQIVEYVK